MSEGGGTGHIPSYDDLIDGIGFDDGLYELDDDNRNGGTDSLEGALLEGSATHTILQIDSLQAAMDNFAGAIDRSAIVVSTGRPVRTPSAQYKGFIAEEYFKRTLKINALAKGVPDYSLGVSTNGSLPDGETLSRIDRHVDISVFTRGHPWSHPMRESDWQSKMHNKASAYIKDLENKQYADVNFVGGAGQGINDTISVEIHGKTVHSDSITPEEATTMADEAKAQSTHPYARRQEKLNELHSVELGRSVKMGAATGFLFSAVSEIIRFLQLLRKGELTKEEFAQSVTNVLLGTADGGIRAGAINEAVFHFGRALGKELGADSPCAVPIMAGANFAVGFAEDLYRCFVEGTIDTDDLLCSMVENSFLSSVSFGGSWAVGQIGRRLLLRSARSAAATGAAIGSPLGPIGTVVGTIVGGIVIGQCGHALVGTAKKDAVLAFSGLIDEIDSHIELEGCERIYYFADTMSSLSNFRFSFKDLLPCYNLISDLKEYNLHRKSIRSVEEQLRSTVDSLDERKSAALRELEASHETRLHELRQSFAEQKEAMQSGYRDSMNAYVANSFAQYASLYEVTTCNADVLRVYLGTQESEHSYVLSYMRHRIKIDNELNDLVSDLLEAKDSDRELKPLIDRLVWFMEQDSLLVGRQFLSFEAALTLISAKETA